MRVLLASERIDSLTILLATLLALGIGCGKSNSSPNPSTDPAGQAGRSERFPRAGERPAQIPKSSVRFEEISRSADVDFTYRNGEEAGHYAILESLGGGACLFDYDGDSKLDSFLPGGGTFGDGPDVRGLPGALFRQGPSLRFQNVTEPAGAGLAPHYSHGAQAADYDNDGFPDLLITGYGGLLLLKNQGDGTFSDVTEESGLSADTRWSSSAAWADLTGNGALDLYVAHYVNWSFANHPICEIPPPHHRDICPPREFEPLPDTVFFSRREGSFDDVSEKIGLRKDGKGLGVVAADLDLDGHIDLYVANDTVANFLYRNRGDGMLEDVSLISGTSFDDAGSPDGSMGVDVADFNQDGLPDLWCVNYENESLALYRNEGNCLFQHVSQSTGIKSASGLFVSWGTAFFDMDGDTFEDVFVSNGHVIRYPSSVPVRQKPVLLANQDGRKFVNIGQDAGEYVNQPHMGRGLAAGDLDDDGHLDLLISHTNEPAAVLHNRTNHGRQWIGLRLIGVSSPRSAIGARIEIPWGNRVLSRQIKGGGSYASTHDLRVHFGLGDRQQIETLRIVWPSGIEQMLTNLSAGHYHTVIEPGRIE